MPARRACLSTTHEHQPAADRAPAALAAIVNAIRELQAIGAPTDWLAPCILDGADDIRAALDSRAHDAGEPLDWRALDDALDRLQDRSAGNVVQFRLL